jgi:hypothetical protein
MDLTLLLTLFRIDTLLKVLLLIIVGLYTIFAIFLFFQIRSLNKLLYIESRNASRIIAIVCFLHIILAISLFVYILAIL